MRDIFQLVSKWLCRFIFSTGAYKTIWPHHTVASVECYCLNGLLRISWETPTLACGLTLCSSCFHWHIPWSPLVGLFCRLSMWLGCRVLSHFLWTLQDIKCVICSFAVSAPFLASVSEFSEMCVCGNAAVLHFCCLWAYDRFFFSLQSAYTSYYIF